MTKTKKQKLIKISAQYLREVIVVVIGVFIAFQLNNYSEYNKDIKDERNSLKRILTDLHTEKNWLEKEKKVFKKKRNVLKNIIYNNNKNSLDSLYLYSAYQYVHYNFGTEFSTLKFSGKLNLIKNDSLRYYLVNYYELSYSLYETLEEEHRAFVRNDLVTYLDKIAEVDTLYLYNSKIIEEKLSDKKLNKLLKEQILYYDLLIHKIKIHRLERLIKLINTNLKTIGND
ncbi:hypothetical protein [Aquimarina sp. 2201CG5-10]|uniref:hypothetical protein n=1 Tax=Aquimarina callyspongiae TaxID=3098150 RepID=UPI002AB5166D|nr:hypothetical protein [Aquimarina sp. 2201CG5-10]MDY8137710.1 hypothetical protein [Aquimarina sp. 2201CG5-10]